MEQALKEQEGDQAEEEEERRLFYVAVTRAKEVRECHNVTGTVEYILLVTAVIGVVIIFTTGHGSGTFQNSLNKVFNETAQDMLNAASYLQQNAANGSGS